MIKTQYDFNNRRRGKHFSSMIQLKISIQTGLRCSVATLDPEKTKADFLYMTGVELELEESKSAKDIYRASLKQTTK